MKMFEILISFEQFLKNHKIVQTIVFRVTIL